MNNKKYYSNHKVRKVADTSFYWDYNSFIFSELCYCGHSKNEHTLSDTQCSKKEEFCNCLGFLA
jgi:hypothetical protein